MINMVKKRSYNFSKVRETYSEKKIYQSKKIERYIEINEMLSNIY